MTSFLRPAIFWLLFTSILCSCLLPEFLSVHFFSLPFILQLPLALLHHPHNSFTNNASRAGRRSFWVVLQTPAEQREVSVC